MTTALMAADLIRDIPDFPQPGIIFKDITPVLQHPEAFAQVIEAFAEYAHTRQPDLIVAIESRGFILGAPMATKLGKGFAPVRKLGKLPHETVQAEYALEYGTSAVEMHRDAVQPGQKVLIVDDLLATGGTVRGTIELVERLQGKVVGLGFLVELEFLKGRDRLQGHRVTSVIRY